MSSFNEKFHIYTGTAIISSCYMFSSLMNWFLSDVVIGYYSIDCLSQLLCPFTLCLTIYFTVSLIKYKNSFYFFSMIFNCLVISLINYLAFGIYSEKSNIYFQALNCLLIIIIILIFFFTIIISYIKIDAASFLYKYTNKKFQLSDFVSSDGLHCVRLFNIEFIVLYLIQMKYSNYLTKFTQKFNGEPYFIFYLLLITFLDEIILFGLKLNKDISKNKEIYLLSLIFRSFSYIYILFQTILEIVYRIKYYALNQSILNPYHKFAQISLLLLVLEIKLYLLLKYRDVLEKKQNESSKIEDQTNVVSSQDTNIQQQHGTVIIPNLVTSNIPKLEDDPEKTQNELQQKNDPTNAESSNFTEVKKNQNEEVITSNEQLSNIQIPEDVKKNFYFERLDQEIINFLTNLDAYSASELIKKCILIVENNKFNYFVETTEVDFFQLDIINNTFDKNFLISWKKNNNNSTSKDNLDVPIISIYIAYYMYSKYFCFWDNCKTANKNTHNIKFIIPSEQNFFNLNSQKILENCKIAVFLIYEKEQYSLCVVDINQKKSYLFYDEKLANNLINLSNKTKTYLKFFSNKSEKANVWTNVKKYLKAINEMSILQLIQKEKQKKIEDIITVNPIKFRKYDPEIESFYKSFEIMEKIFFYGGIGQVTEEKEYIFDTEKYVYRLKKLVDLLKKTFKRK